MISPKKAVRNPATSSTRGRGQVLIKHGGPSQTDSAATWHGFISGLYRLPGHGTLTREVPVL